jgi:hypothetical protein
MKMLSINLIVGILIKDGYSTWALGGASFVSYVNASKYTEPKPKILAMA